MAVGGDAVREKLLIENFARDVEIQIVQSVADVHEHAGLFGVAHLRPELAVRIQ